MNNLMNKLKHLFARMTSSRTSAINEPHHCGQDCQVGDGVAVVKSSEYLKPYLGWEVISVGDMPCDGCPADHYGAQCVKLELIDRSYICLAPQPNSIVTE